MRRLLVAAAGVALMLSFASASFASNRHVISGTAWRLNLDNDPTFEFRILAQVTPSSVIGTYRLTSFDGFEMFGSVTCGAVDGGTAVIGGVISSVTNPTYEGGYFLVWVVDNGQASFGSWGPDVVTTTDVGGGTSGAELGATGSDFPSDFPTSCPTATGDTFQNWSAVPGMRTVLGDLTVR